jgi:hypothetical protein
MKALFIWREESVSFIKDLIKKQFIEGVKFITSESAFNDFIYENSYKSYTKIYILAELGWDKNKLFEGYEKGFQLIEKWKSPNAPCMHYFSLANRKQIYNCVDDKFKFIVKAFPFQDILNINPKYKFPTDDISNSKWVFFKTYALESYGILDVISHRLDGLNEKSYDFVKDLDSVISELKSYKKFTGNEIQKFIDKIEYNTSFVYDLKFLIENRIEELTGQAKAKKFELPTNLKLVVIEDNDEDARIILNGIKRHYKKDTLFNEQVTYFTNGSDALKYVKNKENTIDILISDLQLLDKDEFYQNVQGVEIFDEAKKMQSTVVGIITGFGRKGVSKLLEHDTKFILLKKHLKRFNANEEIDNFLQDLYQEYKRKINSIPYNVGPEKIGWLNTNTYYRKKYSEKITQDKKLHRSIFEKAYKFYDLYRKNNLSHQTQDWDSSLISPKGIKSASFDNIFDKHYSFWAQRLIVLDYAFKNDFIYSKSKFEEIASKFKSTTKGSKLSLGKAYLAQLGLHSEQFYSRKDDNIDDGFIRYGEFEGEKVEEVRKLTLENLFPEERNLLKELGYNERVTIGTQSKDLTKWLNDKFQEFLPHTAFSELTFNELIEQINSLKEKKISGEISGDKIDSIIIDEMPREIEQYFTESEFSDWKKVYDELNDLYQTESPEDI